MTPTPNNEALAALENLLAYVRGKDDLYANGAIRQFAEEAVSALASSGQAASAVPEGWRIERGDGILHVHGPDQSHAISDVLADQAIGGPERLLHKLASALLAASPTQPAGQAASVVPEGWRVQAVSDGDVRVYAPGGETWLLRHGQDGFYGFAHRLASALAASPTQPASAPQAVPGLGRATLHGSVVELQFIDESAAGKFMEDHEPTVDVESMPASAPAREGATLRERLQQRCSDWGVYWRASDAHGVDLSHEQALDLLRDALGVEVEIATPAAPAQPRVDLREALENLLACCKNFVACGVRLDDFAAAQDAIAQAESALGQPLRNDTHAFQNFHRLLCERFNYSHDPMGWRRDQLSLIEHIAKQSALSTPPAPRAPSIEPVGEALERLTLWARTQVGRCECTGDHPIADAERALGWRK